MIRAFYITGYRGSILEIEHDDGSLEIYNSVGEEVSAALSDRLEYLRRQAPDTVKLDGELEEENQAAPLCLCGEEADSEISGEGIPICFRCSQQIEKHDGEQEGEKEMTLRNLLNNLHEGEQNE